MQSSQFFYLVHNESFNTSTDRQDGDILDNDETDQEIIATNECSNDRIRTDQDKNTLVIENMRLLTKLNRLNKKYLTLHNENEILKKTTIRMKSIKFI